MKRFYITRHGEKAKIPGDPLLTSFGILQAQQTGRYLNKFPISKIVASPILRTQQTAKQIANVLKMEYETDQLLKERFCWGDLRNQSFADFLTIWQKSSQNREWQPPIGDSSLNAGRRLEKLISKLIESADKHILLVTHGGITSDFLRNVFSIDVINHFIPDFESTLDDNIKECSITIVEVDPNKPKFKLVELAYAKHIN